MTLSFLELLVYIALLAMMIPLTLWAFYMLYHVLMACIEIYWPWGHGD